MKRSVLLLSFLAASLTSPHLGLASPEPPAARAPAPKARLDRVAVWRQYHELLLRDAIEPFRSAERIPEGERGAARDAINDDEVRVIRAWCAWTACLPEAPHAREVRSQLLSLKPRRKPAEILIRIDRSTAKALAEPTCLELKWDVVPLDADRRMTPLLAGTQPSFVWCSKPHRRPGSDPDWNMFSERTVLPLMRSPDFAEKPELAQLVLANVTSHCEARVHAKAIESYESWEKADAWVLECLKARAALTQAWSARGSDTAASTPKVRMNAFEELMTVAKKHCLKAIAMHPDRAAPYELMLHVCMGTDESLSHWLDLARTVDPLMPAAYYTAIDYQMPRWGGSHQEMLGTGLLAADIARYDSWVPEIIFSAILSVSADGVNIANIVNRPEISLACEKTIAGYLASPLTSPGRRTQYATVAMAIALWRGDFDQVAHWLRYTQGAIDEFELAIWQLSPEEIRQAAGSTGPFGKRLLEAEKLIGGAKFEDARTVLALAESEMPADTNSRLALSRAMFSLKAHEQIAAGKDIEFSLDDTSSCLETILGTGVSLSKDKPVDATSPGFSGRMNLFNIPLSQRWVLTGEISTGDKNSGPMIFRWPMSRPGNAGMERELLVSRGRTTVRSRDSRESASIDTPEPGHQNLWVFHEPKRLTVSINGHYVELDITGKPYSTQPGKYLVFGTRPEFLPGGARPVLKNLKLRMLRSSDPSPRPPGQPYREKPEAKPAPK